MATAEETARVAEARVVAKVEETAAELSVPYKAQNCAAAHEWPNLLQANENSVDIASIGQRRHRATKRSEGARGERGAGSSPGQPNRPVRPRPSPPTPSDPPQSLIAPRRESLSTRLTITADQSTKAVPHRAPARATEGSQVCGAPEDAFVPTRPPSSPLVRCQHARARCGAPVQAWLQAPACRALTGTSYEKWHKIKILCVGVCKESTACGKLSFGE